MTRAHRTWHVRLWTTLAILLVLGLSAALAIRPTDRTASSRLQRVLPAETETER